MARNIGYDPSGKAREVAPGVHVLSQRMGGHVHAFILDDNGELTLIDALFDSDAHRIVAAIKQIGREVSDLKNIIATHAHRSHIGGIATLKALSGATVWSHQFEADILAGERLAQGVAFWPRRPYQVYAIQLGCFLGVDGHKPVETDRFLREGDKVGPLEVIDLPGHSPGHLGFYWKERSALFAGDALATWPYLSLGWDGLTLNIPQHRRTLHKIEDLRADVIAVGHGEPATGDQIDILRRMIRSGTQDPG